MEEEVRKAKIGYVAPQNSDEAIQVLKSIPAKVFGTLKGKGLTLVESVFEKSDSRLSPTKSLYSGMIADVCNKIQREIDDCIVALEK